MRRIFIDQIPLIYGNGWLYRLFYRDQLVYIGMTTSIQPLIRISAHLKDKQFDSYELEQYPLYDLPDIELSEIRKHRPPFNIIGTNKKARPQWISPNIPGSTKQAFTRLDAASYCCEVLRNNGVLLTRKQHQTIYNNIPKLVFRVFVSDDNGRKGYYYTQDALNEFITETLLGQNTILKQKQP